MPGFSRYDAQLNVIETDVTGVTGDRNEIIDEIFDELIALAKFRNKPWVLACWKNVVFTDPTVAAYYGKRTADLLRYVSGVIRYAANDPLTRTYVRSQMIKHREEGTRALLYESREDAIAALEQLRATPAKR